MFYCQGTGHMTVMDDLVQRKLEEKKFDDGEILPLKIKLFQNKSTLEE